MLLSIGSVVAQTHRIVSVIVAHRQHTSLLQLLLFVVTVVSTHVNTYVQDCFEYCTQELHITLFQSWLSHTLAQQFCCLLLHYYEAATATAAASYCCCYRSSLLLPRKAVAACYTAVLPLVPTATGTSSSTSSSSTM
jgi:hypothetical protein